MVLLLGGGGEGGDYGFNCVQMGLKESDERSDVEDRYLNVGRNNKERGEVARREEKG